MRIGRSLAEMMKQKNVPPIMYRDAIAAVQGVDHVHEREIGHKSRPAAKNVIRKSHGRGESKISQIMVQDGLLRYLSCAR